MDNINSIQQVTDLIRKASGQSKIEKPDLDLSSDKFKSNQNVSDLIKEKIITRSSDKNKENEENRQSSKSQIGKNFLGSQLDLVI
tara:strand:- start:20 stop:274 length:255 start_codon:yes stop_codon:yes gene_type:complete